MSIFRIKANFHRIFLKSHEKPNFLAPDDPQLPEIGRDAAKNVCKRFGERIFDF